jgi:hypothetical protein
MRPDSSPPAPPTDQHSHTTPNSGHRVDEIATLLKAGDDVSATSSRRVGLGPVGSSVPHSGPLNDLAGRWIAAAVDHMQVVRHPGSQVPDMRAPPRAWSRLDDRRLDQGHRRRKLRCCVPRYPNIDPQRESWVPPSPRFNRR